MRLEIDKREWKQHLQKYMHSIRKAKHQTWRAFIESADEKSIWQIKKYTESSMTLTYIPTLQGKASSNEEKAKEFQSTFFPQPPSADMSDIKWHH